MLKKNAAAKPRNANELYVFEAVDNKVQSNVWAHVRYAWLYRHFFLYWVKRNLVIRYRQTSIGSLWAILQPLLSSLVYAVVFSLILRVDTGDTPYALFIVSNIVLWTYFQRVIFSGAASVIGSMDIVSRVQFPREFLPLGVWAESVVDLLIGMLIVAFMYVLYSYPVTAYMLITPFIVFTLTILALAGMFLLASLTVVFRDLIQIIPITLQLLLYISPVIYPLTAVPDGLKALYLVNPLGPIFAAYQETMLYGTFTLGGEMLLITAISSVLLYFSYKFYKRMEWKFADIL